MPDAFETILLVGGTGTWGQAATRFLLENTDSIIRIYSRGELLQSEMAARLQHPRLRFLIGDVRDRQRLQLAMHGVDLVFHAAALKQVPSGEYNISEVIATNVYGTENVAMAARETGVKRVVFLSSDKSVAPINSYGVSKALGERIIIQANGYSPHHTEYCCVRYGNVWQSRGSVGLFWAEALQRGEPLRVTDLAMTRFFITAQQAVETAWFAAQHAPRGTILIPRLPAYTMKDLCQAITANAGCASAAFHRIGVRPGEKYHEALLGDDEAPRVVSYVGKEYYYCVPPVMPSWPTRPLEEWGVEEDGFWIECPLDAYRSDTWPYRLTAEKLQQRLEGKD